VLFFRVPCIFLYAHTQQGGISSFGARSTAGVYDDSNDPLPRRERKEQTHTEEEEKKKGRKKKIQPQNWGFSIFLFLYDPVTSQVHKTLNQYNAILIFFTLYPPYNLLLISTKGVKLNGGGTDETVSYCLHHTVCGARVCDGSIKLATAHSTLTQPSNLAYI
jgi:hypothetical protein